MTKSPDTRFPRARRFGARLRYGVLFAGIATLFLGLIAYQLVISHRAARSAAIVNATNLVTILESKLEVELRAAERTVAMFAREIESETMRPESADPPSWIASAWNSHPRRLSTW